jgi:hypothetical protein
VRGDGCRAARGRPGLRQWRRAACGGTDPGAITRCGVAGLSSVGAVQSPQRSDAGPPGMFGITASPADRVRRSLVEGRRAGCSRRRVMAPGFAGSRDDQLESGVRTIGVRRSAAFRSEARAGVLRAPARARSAAGERGGRVRGEDGTPITGLWSKARLRVDVAAGAGDLQGGLQTRPTSGEVEGSVRAGGA